MKIKKLYLNKPLMYGLELTIEFDNGKFYDLNLNKGDNLNNIKEEFDNFILRPLFNDKSRIVRKVIKSGVFKNENSKT